MVESDIWCLHKTLVVFGHAWLSVVKFCECVIHVRCLCVQVLSGGGGGSSKLPRLCM